MDATAGEATATSRGVLARFESWLPLAAATPRITLGEGDTPLIECARLAERLGLAALHVKCEGSNPTGSFKDRGMVVAVAKALEAGAESIICASTGNTSASAAAYGAHCGLQTVVLIPRGKIAPGKLLQAQMYGARVISIEGNFDDALTAVRELASLHEKVVMVNSTNPNRIEGQKTAAYEIVDELGQAPDVLAIPVGNAGNITAYWKGFCEYHAAGRCALPRMIGGQAAGAAPLVVGHPITHPETVATAIRIGNPASAAGARRARDESNGIIGAVTDEDILGAQADLARCEGVFCEPGSAASLAILRKCLADGSVGRGLTAVCVLTGSGLKDPDAVADRQPAPELLTTDAKSLAAALKL